MAPANRERKQSGSIEEEGYAVKHIGSVFKQVCSERIMMALLFFFKLLARSSQTCRLARNHKCTEEMEEIVT